MFCPKLHHRKLCVTLPVNMSTVPNFLNFTGSLLMMLFFVQLLYGNSVINCRALLPLHSYRYFKIHIIFEFGFYRAMHFSAKRGIAIACRLSVCLSVCLSVRNVEVL